MHPPPPTPVPAHRALSNTGRPIRHLQHSDSFHTFMKLLDGFFPPKLLWNTWLFQEKPYKRLKAANFNSSRCPRVPESPSPRVLLCVSALRWTKGCCSLSGLPVRRVSHSFNGAAKNNSEGGCSGTGHRGGRMRDTGRGTGWGGQNTCIATGTGTKTRGRLHHT